MTYRDLVKQAATVNGTGAFTLGAAAAGGYQTMHTGRTLGTVIPYRFTLGNEWETGRGTLGANGVLSRAPAQSSNGGALVNFPAGTGEIVETPIAAEVDDFARLSAGVEASALPLAGALTSADFLTIIQGGAEKRVAIDTIKSYFAAGSGATAPGAPTIGAATAGDGQVSTAFTAPASAGSSAITSYTVTLYKVSDNTPVNSASGPSSPIVVTSANGVAVYSKVKATNTVAGPESAASNSVTPGVAAASTVRLTGTKTSDVTESASAPWTYTSTGGATGATGASYLGAIPANTDGEVIFKVVTKSADFMFGVSTTAGTPAYNNGDTESIWSNGGNSYKTFGTAPTTSAIGQANGDLIRFRKFNSSGSADFRVGFDWSVSKNNGQDWTIISANTVGTNGLRTQPYYFRVVPGSGAVLSVVSQTGFA